MRAPAAGYTGDVAQLGERGLCKPEVVGSIPIISTMEAERKRFMRHRKGRAVL